MSQTTPLQFQPQPPLLPKTTGGKRGPSAPISIPSLANNDDDSDHSITDHSPPVQNRNSTFELPANINKQNSLILLTTSTKSPRGLIGPKKYGTSVASPRVLNNNTIGTFNLNHNTSSFSTSHTSTPTSYIILSNTNNAVFSFNTVNSINTTSNHNDNSGKISQNPPTNVNVGASLLSSTNTSNSDNVIPCITNSNEINVLEQASDLNDCTATTSDNPNSPEVGSSSPSAAFAYEHDHDYDNIASPSSSTSSGPIYVRPPGFKHHAQEIVAPSLTNSLKKKKSYATFSTLKEGFKKREATPPKLKPKREPLPMKLRALPQSFWQQPNVAHQVSPSTLFPVLPPLQNRETEDTLMDERPITPPEEKDTTRKTSQIPERKLTVANTDLLFKLFECISEEKTKTQPVTKTRAQPKSRKLVPKSNTKGLFLGNDPYMVDAVTEKIFPQLTLEGSRHSGGGNTSLQLITFKEGDKTVTLPSLSMEQNYPQMLSELVMHI
ncbi:serine/threonine-protein kinase phg2-like [Biomphalaria glabrata]|uniref:Serine/threonine-protein kinase phg2-like n=1 Tax=Biomphalaria glabrata TaxID=6526 RepID=A0A9W2YKV6_BIOGL|nr:serine/threonine-protein kinase phg2-like [Biomphalaria glabrata]XP_055863425.1 serine/threonine-protein kinase phg2-like [Biomphalaria glabrata]XP_055863426.1 serine/threonine-protein kinase phg2-like [Biomphalaria glabrata]